MTKTVIVISSINDDDWMSRKVIVDGIKASLAYLQGNYRFQEAFLDHNSIDAQEDSIVSICRTLHPEIVFFADHRPVPINLIKKLQAEKISNSCTFIFYIYGIFHLDAIKWFELGHYLENLKTAFLCASDAQVKLLKGYVKNKEIVFKSPFPLQDEIFANKRITSKSDIFQFTYIGRLSFAKNIPQLVTAFCLLKEMTNKDVKLKIYGDVDHIWCPVRQIQFPDKDFNKYLELELSKVPSRYVELIEFHPAVPYSSVNKVLDETDCFVSTSTFHDEDYGLAPREAVLKNIPCVLTNWGGFLDLTKEGIADGCNVKFDKFGPTFSIKEFAQLMFLSLEKEVDTRQIGIEKFGIKAVANLLESIFNMNHSKFNGFSADFESFVNFRKNWSSILKDDDYKKLYFKLYQNYLKDS